MEKQTGKIGIAISTRGREWVLSHSVSQWKRWYLHATVIVVEDNGPVPRGIAATKNLCLEKLREAGVDHCFLVDDDVYPLDDVGIGLYCDSGFHHMCMSFDSRVNGVRISKEVYVQYQHPEWWSFNSPCGCLLYCSRAVLESGIQYDEKFGIWGMEHKDYSLRIHNAGMTPLPFLDIPSSTRHFYSHDYHMSVDSSVPESVRISEINRNIEYYLQKHG